MFGIGGLPVQLRSDAVFQDLGVWVSYGVFVWLLVGLAVGAEKLLSWLCVGVIFGLTVAVSGVVLRHMKVWELIQHLADYVSKSSPTVSTVEAELVKRLIVIMIAVPYSLLVLESFPASDILRRAARPNGSKHAELWLAVAIFLRVFQHVFEVAGNLLLAWREENPRLLLPRHQRDWHGLGAGAGLLRWIKSSVWSWSVTLLEQALLFVPTAVRDWSRIGR